MHQLEFTESIENPIFTSVRFFFESWLGLSDRELWPHHFRSLIALFSLHGFIPEPKSLVSYSIFSTIAAFLFSAGQELIQKLLLSCIHSYIRQAKYIFPLLIQSPSHKINQNPLRENLSTTDTHTSGRKR